MCLYSERTPKPSWSLSKYGHMVSLCRERQREAERMRMTQRWFLARFPHLSRGRPQQAETSYPPRTCVPFPKLKHLAFSTLSITLGSRSGVSTLGYVTLRLLWDENKGNVVPDWLVSYVSFTEQVEELIWNVGIMWWVGQNKNYNSLEQNLAATVNLWSVFIFISASKPMIFSLLSYKCR